MESSLQMIKAHPVFGVGLNNFLVNLPEFQKTHNSVFSLQPVHNIYLLVLAETGIIGFGAFMWLLFKTYYKVKSQKLKVKSSIQNSKVLILSIVLILGLFDHYFLTLQQGQLLLAFVLGYCSKFSSASH